MSSIAARDLRNHTADVLRRIAEGATLTITVHGAPVAELSPVGTTQRHFVSRAELAEILSSHQADPELRVQLEELSGATTDQLDPMT
jgi:prevent-host-death family protein